VSTRLQSIDFLRGVAAFAVVLFHAFAYGHVNTNDRWFHALKLMVDQGYLGVPLFFVISGFCIHQRWARTYAMKGQANVGFSHFWRRRLQRLYPPYFAALCASMLLVVTAYVVRANVPLLGLYPEPKTRWMAIDFVLHAGMLHGFHPVFDQMAGNPPFWTLAREECLYLMYFPLLAISRVRGMKESLLWVLIAGLAFPLSMMPVAISNDGWLRIINTSAIALWIEWALGMAAVEAYYKIIELPRWCSFGWLVPIWGSVAKLSEAYFAQLSPIFWGLTFFTLLNYCLRLERSKTWRESAVVRRFAALGVFSYSLYLVHVPTRIFVKYLFHIPNASSNAWSYTFYALVMASAGCLAGYIFFLAIEQRFLHRNSEKTSTEVVLARPCQDSLQPG